MTQILTLSCVEVGEPRFYSLLHEPVDILALVYASRTKGNTRDLRGGLSFHITTFISRCERWHTLFPSLSSRSSKGICSPQLSGKRMASRIFRPRVETEAYGLKKKIR